MSWQGPLYSLFTLTTKRPQPKWQPGDVSQRCGPASHNLGRWDLRVIKVPTPVQRLWVLGAFRDPRSPSPPRCAACFCMFWDNMQPPPPPSNLPERPSGLPYQRNQKLALTVPKEIGPGSGSSSPGALFGWLGLQAPGSEEARVGQGAALLESGRLESQDQPCLGLHGQKEQRG